MEKINYVARVKAMLKLDDDSKIEKFQKAAVKKWKNQITLREGEIEELEDKLLEVETDRLEDVLFNLDVKEIATTDSRKDYINTYQSNIEDVLIEEEELRDNIEILEKEIKKYKKLISLIE